MDSTDQISPLVKALAPYDSNDLAMCAGALQLLPENSNFVFRLEAFAHVTACLAFRAAASISAGKLRDFSNSQLGKAFGSADDPFPNLFVEEVTFYGGSYKVLPGEMEGAVSYFRYARDAVFREHDLPNPLRSQLVSKVTGALRLSQEVCSRSFLGRGQPFANDAVGVSVPPSNKMSSLKHAITFTREEMELFFGKGSLADAVWADFVCSAGSVSPVSYSAEDGPLLLTPILQSGNTFILVCPHALLAAITHYLVSELIRHGYQTSLAGALNDVVAKNVARSLRVLDGVEVEMEVTGSPVGREQAVSIDSDKLLYAIVISDALENFRPDLPSGGEAVIKNLGRLLDQRVKDIEDQAFSTGRWNGILFLIVHSGIGRTHSFGLNGTSASLLKALSSHDLETISLLEGGNSLALWRFAEQSESVRERAFVHAFSVLDEFAFYKEARYGFYSGDGAAPNVISIGPGYGVRSKAKVMAERDWHAVPGFIPNTITEVGNIEGDLKIPIYAAWPPFTPGIAIFVENFIRPTWILGPANTRGTDMHSMYFEVARTLAFWIWQTSEAVRRYLPVSKTPVLFRLKLPDLSVLTAEKPNSAPPAGGFSAEVDSERRRIVLTVGESGVEQLRAPDNRGEREMLRVALGALFNEFAQKGDEPIAEIIENVAPLGLKKMLLMPDTHTMPELDSRDIPRYRGVQEGDIDDVLEEIGRHLTGTLGMKNGPVPRSERNAVLKAVVRYCYQLLTDLLGSLSADGLFEFLISHSEAVVKEDVLRRLTIPTRQACFGHLGDLSGKLEEELPGVARTGITSRFLIEFAVAHPPHGIRPISLGVYDRLRAIAMQIITFGMQSDTVAYGLTDLELAILDSGRLGRGEPLYRQAQSKHMKDVTQGQIANYTETFRRRFAGPTGKGDPSEQIRKLDEALEAECGFSMTDISLFIAAVRDFGQSMRQDACKASETDLLKEVSQLNSWAPDRAKAIVNLFALEERQSFFEVPEGFEGPDLYPWRFNRALSYIRRPLIRHAGLVLWGNRHLIAFHKNLLGLCLTGRYKAKSDQMKRFLGAVRLEEGKQFNDIVADELEKKGMQVRRRVKKFGQTHIVGDIDVLAADSSTRTLHVVECKNLSLARTPYELRYEIKMILDGDEGKLSVVKKHQKQADWVKDNLPLVMSSLELKESGTWKVEASIVVDESLMSSHLRSSPLRILTFQQMRQEGLRKKS